jgi:quercetin dioxygenase-like cupin family protein
MPTVSEGGAVKLVWKSEAVPARNDEEIETTAPDFDFALVRRGGTAFVIVEIPPGQELAPPGMHATDTLDYLVVLRGRLELVVQTGSVILDPGDVVIDRGVYHGSRAVGNESAVLAVVLIPAEPVGSRQREL